MPIEEDKSGGRPSLDRAHRADLPPKYGLRRRAVWPRKFRLDRDAAIAWIAVIYILGFMIFYVIDEKARPTARAAEDASSAFGWVEPALQSNPGFEADTDWGAGRNATAG